jgi:signal transduction histidine kinase/CheY-like chemotaxis protein
MDRDTRQAILPLRFIMAFAQAEQEAAFQQHHAALSYRYAQAATLLAMLLVAGDFVADAIAYPLVAANFLRLCLILPMMAAGLASSFSARVRRHWQLAASVSLVVNAIGIFWMLWQIQRQGGAGLDSWVGMVNFCFIEFFCFVALGIRFRYALVTGSVMFLILVGLLGLGAPYSLGHKAYYVFHVLVLAGGAGWWRDFILRKEFALMRSMEQGRHAAETLARAKNDFLANMSHEILTPINAIQGLTFLLRDRADAEQTKQLNKISDAGEHLLAIMNDILDVAEIDGGNLRLEEGDLSLSRLLGNVHTLIAAAAAAKGLRIRVEKGAVPEYLRGDQIRLRQALVNYAVNAVKFTESGTITIRTKLLETSAEDMLVRFEIEDTGIGIPADEVTRLFQSFEQGDASATRQYGGTGLGLAITQKLAKLMDGEAGADSAPGIGSTFWFTARLKRGAATAERAESAVDKLKRHCDQARLLLVDDNAINREVAQEMLKNAGLRFDVAENGLEALQKAGEERYDLILMDMQMPKMDGLAATRAILAQSGEHQPQILAMSANHFARDRQACRDAGMTGFVAKPVEPEVLYETLWRHLTD